jgi:hypothetical protein
MTETKNILLTAINVPEQFTIYGGTIMFVEIRAELLAWSNNEPIVLIQINNLPAMVAINIKWTEFLNIVDEIVTNHFKQQLIA